MTELQGGRQEYLDAWARICDASRREFQKIYDRLGVSLTGEGGRGAAWFFCEVCFVVRRGWGAESSSCL